MEPTAKTRNLRKKRRVFGWVFLVSIALLLVSIAVLAISYGPDHPIAWAVTDSIDEIAVWMIDRITGWEAPVVEEKAETEEAPLDPDPEPEPEPDPEPELVPSDVFVLDEIVVTGSKASPSLDKTALVLVVSLLTSLTSLIGFITTTVLAYRKDKREELTVKIAVERSELELEKLRFELEKAKKEPDGAS